MDRAYVVLAGLLVLVVGIVALPFLFIAVAFAQPIGRFAGSWGSGADIERYALPRWAQWLGTPDEPLPGGFYEPRVVRRYKAFGWYLTSVLWLMDNRANGLAHALGRPWAEGLWRREWVAGPIKLIVGWRQAYAAPAVGVDAEPEATYVARLHAANVYVAVPSVSIRWARED